MGWIIGLAEFLVSLEWDANASQIFFPAANNSSIRIYKPEERHCSMRVKPVVQQTT